MSTQEFQTKLAAARTVREVEQLLTVWFTVSGTFEELRQLREATVARWEQLEAEAGAAVAA